MMQSNWKEQIMGSDQTIKIILQFVDEASAAVEGATATIGSALGNLSSSTVGRINDAFSNLGNQTKTTFSLMGESSTELSSLMASAMMSTANSIHPVRQAFSNFASTLGNAFMAPVKGAMGLITNLVEHFRWASLFVGGLALGIGEKMLGMAADVEQTRVAFETLLKSPQQAGDLLDWITKISLQTPLTRVQVEDLSRTFLAYGNNLEETKKAAMAVIEATSALGISQTRVSTITYNLGQLTTSTTASYRELRDLQKEGVNTSMLLAQAVNEGTLKLAGFGSGATGTAGASKKLTTEFKAASGSLDEYQARLAIANQRLKEHEANSKTHVSTLMADKEAVRGYQEKIADANNIINQYNTAQAKASSGALVHAANLKQLTRDQEELILKQNNGKAIAQALEDQMLKTYGGAALRQVKTMSGLISNFGDVFQYVVQKALGILSNGDVVIGGAFDKIRNAVATVVNFLLAHADDIGNFFNKFLSSLPGLIAVAGVLGGMLLGGLWGIIMPITLAGALIGTLSYWVGVLIEKNGGVVKTFNDLKGALDAALKAIQPVVDFLIKNKDYIIGALVGIAAAVTVALIPAMVHAIAVAYTLAAAWMVTASPVIVLIAIFAALGIAIVAVIKHWDAIKQAAIAAVMAIGAWLANLWTVVSTTFNNILITIGNFITSVINWFASLPAKVMAFINKLFLEDIPFAIGFMIGFVLVSVPRLLVQFVQWFIQTGINIITEVSSWPGKFMNWINQLVNQAITAIIDFGIGLLTDLGLVGVGLVEEVSTWPSKIMDWLGTLPGLIEKLLEDVKEKFTTGLANIWKEITGWKDKVVGAFDAIGKSISGALDTAAKAFAKGFKAGGSFQHGGIVPGPYGEAVPIIAHAGERVVPTSGLINNQGGLGGAGVTINFTGPVNMDSDDRVRQLADRIISILGRQNELSRYGVGFSNI